MSLVISDLHVDSRVIGGFRQLHFSKFSEFLFLSLVMEEFAKLTSETTTRGGSGERAVIYYIEKLVMWTVSCVF